MKTALSINPSAAMPHLPPPISLAARKHIHVLAVKNSVAVAGPLRKLVFFLKKEATQDITYRWKKDRASHHAQATRRDKP